MFVSSALIWATAVPRADGCEANFISPCQMDEPTWWLDWDYMCHADCGSQSEPQQDPFLGDYWTSGCGGGKMIWQAWVWCVTPPL